MSIDLAIGPGLDHATITASPEYGRAVTFEVRWRDVRLGNDWYNRRREPRFVVGLLGSDGAGFSQHVSFERAVSACLSRARRYDKAYSVPRGIAA